MRAQTFVEIFRSRHGPVASRERYFRDQGTATAGPDPVYEAIMTRDRISRAESNPDRPRDLRLYSRRRLAKSVERATMESWACTRNVLGSTSSHEGAVV